MKVKSNYVKLSLIALGIAGLFTTVNTNAFFTMSNSYCNNNYFPNCSLDTNRLVSRFHNVSNSLGNDFTTYNNYNYYYKNFSDSAGSRYVINTGDYISNGFLKGYNDGDYTSFGAYAYNTSYNYAPKATYSFVKITTDGSLTTYGVWSDEIKSYVNHTVSQLPDISSGAFTDSWEYYAPWHGSIVFYNAGFKDNMKTVQFIGRQTLYDYVIYVDTLASHDNVWLIDYSNKKAWSYTEDDIDVLSMLLFGSISFDKDLIDDFGWDTTYDILFNTGGNYFFPDTYGNRACSNVGSSNNTNSNSEAGYTSCSRFNAGFTFVSTVFEKPNYGGGSSSGSGNNTFDPGIETYEQCRDQISVIKNIAANEYACRNTIDPDCECIWGNCSCFSSGNYQDLYTFLRNYEGTGQYIGNLNTSCSIWYSKTTALYNGSWSGNYARLFLTANSWSDDPNSIQISDYCGSYPSSSSEQGWACQYLGIGCYDFSIDGVVEAIGEHLTPLFGEYIDKYKNAYLSGYNYLDPSPVCSSDIYGKSYSWGNFAVVFVAGRLIFVIYSVFKD